MYALKNWFLVLYRRSQLAMRASKSFSVDFRRVRQFRHLFRNICLKCWKMNSKYFIDTKIIIIMWKCFLFLILQYSKWYFPIFVRILQLICLQNLFYLTSLCSYDVLGKLWWLGNKYLTSHDFSIFHKLTNRLI